MTQRWRNWTLHTRGNKQSIWAICIECITNPIQDQFLALPSMPTTSLILMVFWLLVWQIWILYIVGGWIVADFWNTNISFNSANILFVTLWTDQRVQGVCQHNQGTIWVNKRAKLTTLYKDKSKNTFVIPELVVVFTGIIHYLSDFWLSNKPMQISPSIMQHDTKKRLLTVT